MADKRAVLLCSLFAGVGTALAQSRPITLDEAIDLTLKQNRGITEAHADTAHYEQLKAKARADYFPQIRNNSEVTYITSREGIVIPAGSFGSFPSAGLLPARTLRIDQGAVANYSSRTEAIQPLTQLFGIRESNRMAKADVRRSAANEQNTRIETVANVHRLFYGVLVARQQLRASQTGLIAAQEHSHEEEAMLREGSALLADVLKAHSQQSQAEAAVVSSRIQARDEAIQLNAALSLPIATPIEPLLPPTTAEGTAGLPDRAEGLRIALAQEPSLLAAQQSVEKARASVRLAETAYLPTITANAHESYQSGIAFLNHNYGVFSGQVGITLFDGGKRRAEVDDAKSLLLKAELALDNQREQTTVAVEVTYDQVEAAEADLRAKRLANDASTETERETISRFNNGELLPSERDTAIAVHSSSEAALLESRLNLALARVQVQRVLGQIPR